MNLEIPNYFDSAVVIHDLQHVQELWAASASECITLVHENNQFVAMWSNHCGLICSNSHSQ